MTYLFITNIGTEETFLKYVLVIRKQNTEDILFCHCASGVYAT